jgi:Flp pilus assembly protein TadD
MPRRSILIAVCVIVLITSAAFGWWYTDQLKSERRVQQDSALVSGIEAFKAQDFSAALSELRRVPSNHPEGSRARYFEGSAQIMLKNYDRAVPLLEEALALDPTHTRTMHALGVAYFKLGNLAMSKAYFAKVLEIDPGDEEARGLMDIMANLERQSKPGAAAEETPGD